MFMSNKVQKRKSDPTAESASFLPRNEKSTVRDDILAAAKSVKGKKAEIGGAVAAMGAGRAEARRRRIDQILAEREASVRKQDQGAADAYRRRPKFNNPGAVETVKGKNVHR